MLDVVMLSVEAPFLRVNVFTKNANNQDRSAARFCPQVAAWRLDTFCYFFLVKSYKIVNNSATDEARAKISTYLEFLEFYKKNFASFNNLT